MDTQGETGFWKCLVLEILSDLPHYYGRNNWDAGRFGPYQRPLYEIPLFLLNRFANAGVTPSCSCPAHQLNDTIARMEPYLDGYASSYAILGDDYSRDLFVRLVAYRILGFHKVKLPLSPENDDLEKAKDRVRHLIDPSGQTHHSGIWILDLMDLSPLGYPVRCISTQSGILATFLLKQYEYRRGNMVVAVSPGDYIIDGGGGWGDTALFFSSAAGSQGKVFSFEFDPLNLALFRRNLELNPEISGRITIVPSALWSESGKTVQYAANGPGTTIAPGYEQRVIEKELQVSTISIDDFVRQEGLPRVDFLKLDIEAAEPEALKGAVDTIRRFRPILAVAVYHNASDMAQIPPYLKELTENYAFYLDHFTMHHEETVLFAVPLEKAERLRKESQ